MFHAKFIGIFVIYIHRMFTRGAQMILLCRHQT